MEYGRVLFEGLKKLAGQLEECYDSKVLQSGFNAKTFQYNFGVGRFHMLPYPYEFSHGLCLNTLLQVWLIANQRNQVTPFRYINQDDEVSRFVR